MKVITLFLKRNTNDRGEKSAICKKKCSVCKTIITLEYIKVMWYQELRHLSKLTLELCTGSCKQIRPVIWSHSYEYISSEVCIFQETFRLLKRGVKNLED